jgi:SAM-dependent methyltransferase
MTENYLLAGGSAELERLRLQARVWEPEAEAMLGRIGVESGWNCIDLGCGGMGILGPLSRAAPHGRVVGLDSDAKQLAAAREYVEHNRLANVEILEGDAYRSALPRQSFDLTHVRFVFAPAGRDAELLAEMLHLTRPGGVIAIQEPDATPWSCYPSHSAWDRLKDAILSAFRLGGGDFNAGQRSFAMLRGAGLRDVQIRAAAVALSDTHPYKRLPVQFATSLRDRIVDNGILSVDELDNAIAECEQIAADPATVVMSFIVTQVWGRVAGGR